MVVGWAEERVVVVVDEEGLGRFENEVDDLVVNVYEPLVENDEVGGDPFYEGT